MSAEGTHTGRMVEIDPSVMRVTTGALEALIRCNRGSWFLISPDGRLFVTTDPGDLIRVLLIETPADTILGGAPGSPR